MAEQTSPTRLPRAVIVEFDFAALDGASLLFEVAKKRLAEAGIDLTLKLEALHLANGNCQGALRELFDVFGKKNDPAKAARELMEAFHVALTEKAAEAFTPGFKAFISAVSANGLKTVIATRADIEALPPLLAEFDPNLVVPYAEPSLTYGNCKWDAWRRAARANDLHEMLTVAITGSGYGVKSALVAGFPVLAVMHDHVAYQDFGGADEVVRELNSAAAKAVLEILRV